MTSFQCQSDGYPTPNITWIHNNSTTLPNGITQVCRIIILLKSGHLNDNNNT